MSGAESDNGKLPTDKSLINELLEALQEVVFPTRCVFCRAAGNWWCEICRQKVEIIKKDLCAGCCASFSDHECKKNWSALQGIVATGFYHNPELRAVLHNLKYKGVTKVANDLKSYLDEWKMQRLEAWPWAGLSELSVQYVPATPKRERERGFDQSSFLADLVLESLVPWATKGDFLLRKESLTAQASLRHDASRLKNIANSFNLKKGIRVPKNILLVDDVVTTGATINEAAEILKKGGAERLFGFALALGS